MRRKSIEAFLSQFSKQYHKCVFNIGNLTKLGGEKTTTFMFSILQNGIFSRSVVLTGAGLKLLVVRPPLQRHCLFSNSML